MEHEIRLATEQDIPQIMEFIDTHWRKGHILSRDRVLFEWQYKEGSDVHMVLGFRENILCGVLGFVTYGTSEEKDLALALWKALEGEGFLGIQMLAYVMEQVPHRLLMCTGINRTTTAAIYERMGLRTGVMVQWYRLNRTEHYRIAKVVDESIPSVKTMHAEIRELASFAEFDTLFDYEDDAFKDAIPYKSREYIRHRYYDHPSYVYHVMGHICGEKVKTALVIRVQECNGSCAIRVVDVLGDSSTVACFTPFLDEYMQQNHAEYMDLYEVGLSEEMLKEAGWKQVAGSGNIIPNYFAPYAAENIDIYYCTADEKAVLFKGDGDQDRPG